MDKNTVKLYLPLKFILGPRQQEVINWFDLVDQKHIQKATAHTNYRIFL